MNTDVDIFFLSEKKAAYDDLVRFLSGKTPAYRLQYVDNLDQLSPVDRTLKQCSLVLCDPCGKEAILSAAAGLVDEARAFLPVVAIKNGAGFSREFRATPAYQRLAGVVELGKGWNGTWNEIVKLRNRWKSPVMHSRIEDVSPSDVLQMIGVSQWTSVVRLEGSHATKGAGKTGDKRIRGCISFSKGIPENAWSTCHVGAEAIWELLSLNEGILEVIQGRWMCDVKNLKNTIDEILFAFALRQDEAPRHVRRKVLRTGREEEAETVIVSMKNERDRRTGDAAVIEKPQWTFSSRRPLLDGWWRRGHAVTGMLTKAETGSFPLRWLSEREIDRLASGGTEARFLSLLGDEPRLRSVFKLFARGFEPERLIKDNFPTVRLGKFDTACLYLAGIRSIETMPNALRTFPFIVWMDDNRHAAAAQALERARCPAALFFSEDPAMHPPLQPRDDAAIAYCILPSPREEWRHVVARFGLLFEALAVLNEGNGTS